MRELLGYTESSKTQSGSCIRQTCSFFTPQFSNIAKAIVQAVMGAEVSAMPSPSLCGSKAPTLTGGFVNRKHKESSNG